MNLNNILLIDDEELVKDSYIDDNVSKNTIRVAILYIQDTIIERVIGTCLFNKLRELICTNEICNNENVFYKELLDDYLFPIFTYGVQAEISIPLSFKERNAGMISNNDPNYTQTSIKDIQHIANWYKMKSDFYMNRAINYLKCNKNNFDELKNCDCNCTVPALQNKFKTGINLDNTPTFKKYIR